MTTYTAILNTETDPGKPVKSDLAKRWSSNVLAMFEGDASASGVRLQRPALADTIINRVKLDSTLVTQAFSLTSGSSQTFTLNPYCFLPGVTNGSANITFPGGSVSETPRVSVNNPTGGTITGNLFWRYINA